MRPRRHRRPLRPLLRSPLVHWTAAAVIGLGTFAVLQARSADLDRRSAALGPTSAVVVVTADLAAGERIGPDDVELRDLPESMVPVAALREVPDDARLRVAVGVGEVLVSSRLAGTPASALAAAIPDGWRAVAVPMAPGGLELSAGDRIDVLALATDGSSAAVATDAHVLDSSAESVTIAVPHDDVAAVADAILAATLTISLAGAP